MELSLEPSPKQTPPPKTSVNSKLAKKTLITTLSQEQESNPPNRQVTEPEKHRGTTAGVRERLSLWVLVLKCELWGRERDSETQDCGTFEIRS